MGLTACAAGGQVWTRLAVLASLYAVLCVVKLGYGYAVKILAAYYARYYARKHGSKGPYASRAPQVVRQPAAAAAGGGGGLLTGPLQPGEPGPSPAHARRCGRPFPQKRKKESKKERAKRKRKQEPPRETGRPFPPSCEALPAVRLLGSKASLRLFRTASTGTPPRARPHVGRLSRPVIPSPSRHRRPCRSAACHAAARHAACRSAAGPERPASAAAPPRAALRVAWTSLHVSNGGAATCAGAHRARAACERRCGRGAGRVRVAVRELGAGEASTRAVLAARHGEGCDSMRTRETRPTQACVTVAFPRVRPASCSPSR